MVHSEDHHRLYNLLKRRARQIKVSHSKGKLFQKFDSEAK